VTRMSSENTGRLSIHARETTARDGRFLVNTAYRARYRAVLEERLPPQLKPFAAFFANLNRLAIMSDMLDRHVGRKSRRILNAGSGTFAAEIFSAAFQNRQITSFDYTEAFADLFPVFQQEGLLATTEFSRADANTVAFPALSFDLAVFHDIFYETALNVPDVLARYRGFVKPDGFVYLDFMNEGTAWLWRLIGKERQYRRYSRAQILKALENSGFELLELRRSSGASSRAVIILNWALWTFFRTSNAFALVARKRYSGDC
jgi:SAM-dependent methyltransferase